MKDINNVALKYNIGTEYKLDPNDAVSVDIAIDNLKKQDGSFVQFYKAQGTTCDSFPNPDDFVLIFMNSVQTELLKKFGENIVCVDGTHGIGYDFTLFSIVIMDEYYTGFPCALMISNRQDGMILEFFYQTVKNVVGHITTKTFMPDMATEPYTSWGNVMGPVQNQLFCSWHVRKSWKENLSKIKIEEKRTTTFQFLKVVADELDKDKFTILLEDLKKSFEEDFDLKAYGAYFMQHYYTTQQIEIC